MVFFSQFSRSRAVFCLYVRSVHLDSSRRGPVTIICDCYCSARAAFSVRKTIINEMRKRRTRRQQQEDDDEEEEENDDGHHRRRRHQEYVWRRSHHWRRVLLSVCLAGHLIVTSTYCYPSGSRFQSTAINDSILKFHLPLTSTTAWATGDTCPVTFLIPLQARAILNYWGTSLRNRSVSITILYLHLVLLYNIDLCSVLWVLFFSRVWFLVKSLCGFD